MSPDLLLEKVEPKIYRDTTEGGCWYWLGELNRNGYGIVRRSGYKEVAHRVLWWIFRGRVPPKRMLDHLCRNRQCCNPHHLEPVTNRENVIRGNRARRMLALQAAAA